ncbi:XRE family transcriptional regulator [Actinomadura craniellae]|uniref:XRE family transcriptional regulator n=1 Tax=Actinomadura craniellae TaxID=2231787 RepID=A0A365H7I6_9ACTN|nr:XRE family transcriptional regulator [Actinomadura craniellae]RAY15047.1 XRE family transcriptional regulator [Actinomadura craniellae]
MTSQIRAWERGDHFPRDYVATLAAVFGLDPDDLFPPEETAAGQLADTGPPAGRGVALDLVSAVTTDGPEADAAYVQGLRETSQALVRLDTLHGGDDVLPLALRVFRAGSHRLGTGAYRPGVQRDLEAAVGEAGEVAAWMAYDADQQPVSRQIIQEAMMLSRLAGDRHMELFQLSHLAMQSVYLHRPAEALRIALSLTDEALPPRISALFDIRRGRALAQLGDTAGADDAFARASVILADGIGPSDPYWTWWMTDAELMWHRGAAAADRGDWVRAATLLHASAEARATARRARYNDLTHLLNALVRARAWADAEPVIGEVAAHLGEVESTRTTNLLRRVVERIVRDGGASSTVADTAASLRGALAGP